MTHPILSVRNVSVRFGGIAALDDISFDLRRGLITGLIGPNGAGKTTLFNCLSRLYDATGGDILFEGRSILGCPAHRVAELGIGRTFQNLALFHNLSVFENVRIGGHSRSRCDYLSDALQLPWKRRNEQTLERKAREIMDYLDLTRVAFDRAGNLPFGVQKKVELARALAMDPTLPLLDEPACGLNHEEVTELGDVIQNIRDDRNMTILLVEHHMGLVMSICDTIVALNFGRKIVEGPPTVVRTDAELIGAYLGAEKQ